MATFLSSAPLPQRPIFLSRRYLASRASVLTIASGFLPSVSPSLLSSLCHQTGSFFPSLPVNVTGALTHSRDLIWKKTPLTTKFDCDGKFHRVAREKYLLRGVVSPTRCIYPPTLSTVTFCDNTVTVAVQRSERLTFLKLYHNQALALVLPLLRC